MKKIILLCIVIFCSGCGILNRTKTVTKTETIIKIDTIIVVKTDTIKSIGSIPFDSLFNHDTLKVESSTATAKTYYNIKSEKIELSLTGKNFKVPVTIAAKVKETKKVVQSHNKTFEQIIILIDIIAGLILAYYLIEFLHKFLNKK
jgi:hypothetical protein